MDEQDKRRSVVGVQTRQQRFECSQCKSRFGRRDHLTRHVKIHDRGVCVSKRKSKGENGRRGRRRFQCPQCNTHFIWEAHLKRHLQTHSNGPTRPFKCSHSGCSSSFGRMDHLTRHLKIHSETGKQTTAISPLPFEFQCSECGKLFQKQGLLRIHVERIHGILDLHQNQFGCVFCSKTFNSKAAEMEHYLFHIEEKPFSCNLCEKSFSTEKNRKNHMFSHTGEQRSTCDLCGKTFDYALLLRRHKRRMHPDPEEAIKRKEIGFICDMCNRRLSSEENLIQHKRRYHVDRTENEDKSFPKEGTGVIPKILFCDICKWRFTSEKNLYKHITRMHPEADPGPCPPRPIYSCNHCKKTFNSSNKRWRHEKRVHSKSRLKMISTESSQLFPKPINAERENGKQRYSLRSRASPVSDRQVRSRRKRKTITTAKLKKLTKNLKNCKRERHQSPPPPVEKTFQCQDSTDSVQEVTHQEEVRSTESPTFPSDDKVEGTVKYSLRSRVLLKRNDELLDSRRNRRNVKKLAKHLEKFNPTGLQLSPLAEIGNEPSHKAVEFRNGKTETSAFQTITDSCNDQRASSSPSANESLFRQVTASLPEVPSMLEATIPLEEKDVLGDEWDNSSHSVKTSSCKPRETVDSHLNDADKCETVTNLTKYGLDNLSALANGDDDDFSFSSTVNSLIENLTRLIQTEQNISSPSSFEVASCSTTSVTDYFQKYDCPTLKNSEPKPFAPTDKSVTESYELGRSHECHDFIPITASTSKAQGEHATNDDNISPVSASTTEDLKELDTLKSCGNSSLPVFPVPSTSNELMSSVQNESKPSTSKSKRSSLQTEGGDSVSRKKKVRFAENLAVVREIERDSSPPLPENPHHSIPNDNQQTQSHQDGSTSNHLVPPMSISSNSEACIFCGKEFASGVGLHAHLLYHIEERPFFCLVCDYSSPIRECLKRHMRQCHGQD